jgi:hypothetical protein
MPLIPEAHINLKPKKSSRMDERLILAAATATQHQKLKGQHRFDFVFSN